MNSTERRVYLHIGLHKTGTTYLQNVFRANREGLREQGIYFPGGSGTAVQRFAVWDLIGRRPPKGERDDRIAGQWKALVEAVRETDSMTSLVSEECLSLATVRQVNTAVRAFPEADVHAVVTARDLGRVLVSAWQEEVKNEQTWTWAEFSAGVRDPKAQAVNPARGFWMRQDLTAILEAWQASLPAEKIHIVTVPGAGSPSSLLLDRFASVVGFDAGKLDEDPPWTNETVGVAGTEVIRRLNERLGGRLTQRQYDRAMKLTIARILAVRTDPVRLTLPAEDFDWVHERAQAMINRVRAGAFPIVGDIDELEPRLAEGRRPDDPSDAELLDAALTALAGVSERYAKEWWARKRPDRGPAGESAKVRAASNARAAVFRSQRAAVDLADRNRVAGRALGFYMRARASARRRAARG